MARGVQAGLAVAMVCVSLLLAPSVGAASESPIRSATVVGDDPGLIDVRVDAVHFDERAGTLTVTGGVRCNAAAAQLTHVHVEATQAQGHRRAAGFAFALPACGEPFTVAMPRPEGPAFRAGRAQIDVVAHACILGCTSEQLRLEVRLDREK